MALSKQQKKELIEAVAIVGAALLVFYFLHRGTGGNAVDSGIPYSGTVGGGPGSLQINYPNGSFTGGGGPPAEQAPYFYSGPDSHSIGGNTFGPSEFNTNSSPCGCCSAPSAAGDAFPTPQAAARYIHTLTYDQAGRHEVDTPVPEIPGITFYPNTPPNSEAFVDTSPTVIGTANDTPDYLSDHLYGVGLGITNP